MLGIQAYMAVFKLNVQCNACMSDYKRKWLCLRTKYRRADKFDTSVTGQQRQGAPLHKPDGGQSCHQNLA